MRRITSVLLFVSFIVIAITGLWMVFSHHGPPKRIPSQTPSLSGDTVPQSEKKTAPERRRPPFFPRVLHEWSGYIMMVLTLIHLVFNYRMMLAHCGIFKKGEKCV